jgi:acyl dehydratase
LIWWEDFKVGDEAELGRHTFTEEEIVRFARQFDPQPFHLDAEQARAGPFGSLIASGWHTCAVGMRLLCDALMHRSVSLGSPGVDEIRWLKPVRAGDTIAYRRIVVESRASSTRKGVGLVKQRWEAVNQHGELVLTMEGWGFFGRKN